VLNTSDEKNRFTSLCPVTAKHVYGILSWIVKHLKFYVVVLYRDDLTIKFGSGVVV
jgi:hypothetical protein